MRKIELHDLTVTLEPGYAAVPLHPNPPPASLVFCIVTRENPDPASGHFVLVRRTPKANVFLGCMRDGLRRPVEWIEVWVQNVTPSENVHPAYRRNLGNAVLDRQWEELAAELRDSSPGDFFSSAAENQPSAPIWIDLSAGLPVHAEGPKGKGWSLCVNDATLAAAGLPPYGDSLARYLWSEESGPEGFFVPVTSSAPTNERTRSLPEAVPASAQWVPFNVNGARMLFRRFSPLSLEEFTDVLGGRSWRGIENARKAFHPGGVYRLLEDEDLLRCGTAHLFSASAGRSGRYSETLHLKVQTIVQACRLVREAIGKTQLPFLNLSAESFRVMLGATGLDLPFMWTQKLTLAEPGVGFPLPIENSSERYFQTAEPLTASIYRPAELAVAKSGLGSVRIRKVYPGGADGLVLEGTLTTQERMGVDESELIWVQLPVPEGKVDLYGFRDSTQAMAVGEALFRTIPQKVSNATAASLQAVAGVPFNQAPFSILPPLSSPCDLYSLGVLATRILLVNPRNSLPQALDAVLSLARQAATDHVAAAPVGERVRKIAESDKRWIDTLGPQHLRQEDCSSEEAFAGIPAKLWWDLIAVIVRFFPGAGPDSFCRGFGDAAPLALHAVLDGPLAELETVAIRSRALITIGWQQNLEIATLVKIAEEQYP